MQEPGDADSPPLRVGVLADTIGRPGGIGRYTSELVAALGRREDVRLIVAALPAAEGRVRELAGARLDATIPIPASSQLGIAAWERYRSGSKFAAAGAQIVHGTKHLVPRTKVPTVLTVHDLMTITRAHESSGPKRLILPRQYRTSLDQATGLVAASERDPRPPARAQPGVGPEDGGGAERVQPQAHRHRRRARAGAGRHPLRARGRRPRATEERRPPAVDLGGGRGGRAGVPARRARPPGTAQHRDHPAPRPSRSGGHRGLAPRRGRRRACVGATGRRPSCCSRRSRRASASRCSRR